MISVTKLLFETKHFGDHLRYGTGPVRRGYGASPDSGPVVVWNATRTCNLSCLHCYASAQPGKFQGELTTAEAVALIEDLARIKVPVILFSGGEPLLRDDVLFLSEYAAEKGIRPTISTNGTLINPEMVRRFMDIGVGYVGISLDGVGEVNDRFRGRPGAFEKALAGIRHCKEGGQRVGLRFTINRHNRNALPSIFDLIESEGIPRVCFYHLVYSGRGSGMVEQDVTHEETRAIMDLIIDRALRFEEQGLDVEILTVDNHADGVYLYLRALREFPQRAGRILELLRANGGNRSGVAFGNLDSQGFVHPDQFTPNHSFGNVRETSFSEIWYHSQHPILVGLRDRRPLLKGRCSRCRWLDVCNGNFRARAEAVTGDFWESDPACYLTDEEILG
ncbi:MAG: putative heme d1 biosynthesis radical SAM protein NirJ1 [Firmicutes bacterium]|nr:putative heme d1 biosynthesis radical SAM protein NirJ1 [Bacillota bacterium]